MRIAMIDNSRGWGGAEQVLLLVASQLKAGGDDVTVFLREGAATVEPFRKAGHTVCSIPRKGLNMLAGMVQLVRRVRREGFDLIHVHRNHDLPVGKIAAMAAGIPLLLTQHCLLGSTSNAIITLADRIVAVSSFIGDDMVQRFPALKGKVNVILNGIDLTPFKNPGREFWEKVPAVAGARPLLGAIGYFYKNQEELIALMPRIREKLPQAKLLIIGRDEEKQKSLEKVALELSVHEAVHFPGNIPHAEIGDAMADLDFNVSAFRREGCALNVIESLAVGTPFVGYRSGSYPELVLDGETGALADTQEEFVRLLVELYGEPQRLAAMRERAREDAFERFDVSRMVQGYRNHYRQMTGSNS
ncbi:MAG TPA: hypothetical protein DCZ75_14385 [Geobacter sp.]|nr:hypothetical protein [Geobacter sp.]